MKPYEDALRQISSIYPFQPSQKEFITICQLQKLPQLAPRSLPHLCLLFALTLFIWSTVSKCLSNGDLIKKRKETTAMFL